MKSAEIDLDAINKVVGICYAGRSGSYLLSNLLDGHSELLSCPPHALHNSPFLIYQIIEKVKSENIQSVEKIVYMLIEAHPFLFQDADHSLLLPGYKNKEIGVDKTKFFDFAVSLLKTHFASGKTAYPKTLFALIHWAYEACKKTPSKVRAPSIVWQRHMPMENDHLEFLSNEFDNFVLLTCVRQLEIALDSHLAHHINERPFGTQEKIFSTLFAQFFNSISRKKQTFAQYAVRFEDMHLNTELVMNKICNLLDIGFEDILTQTTMDGLPFHFYKNGKKITGLNKNLTTEVKTTVLTETDKSFIQVLLNKFLKAYDYEAPSSEISEHLLNNELPFNEIGKLVIGKEAIPLL